MGSKIEQLIDQLKNVGLIEKVVLPKAKKQVHKFLDPIDGTEYVTYVTGYIRRGRVSFWRGKMLEVINPKKRTRDRTNRLVSILLLLNTEEARLERLYEYFKKKHKIRTKKQL